MSNQGPIITLSSCSCSPYTFRTRCYQTLQKLCYHDTETGNRQDGKDTVNADVGHAALLAGLVVIFVLHPRVQVAQHLPPPSADRFTGSDRAATVQPSRMFVGFHDRPIILQQQPLRQHLGHLLSNHSFYWTLAYTFVQSQSNGTEYCYKWEQWSGCWLGWVLEARVSPPGG